ncbi:aminodeoxychorismate synthase component I [Gaoshiqia sp. Z1-71]|uniref:aminodeoxychorismate synthase component I n=1 Tax=Gaoshiqia hydrogeniformans TaxID=3290090 RepID=UPI003BF7CCC3
MNELGKSGRPFVFLIDFDFQQALVYEWEESKEHLLWKTPEHQNFEPKNNIKTELQWDVEPVSFDHYQKAFELVQCHIRYGDSFLLNLTLPSRVKTNLTLEELFYLGKAPYQVYLKDKFVCFSPEIFVRIENRQISSYPMKGTIDANIPDAENRLINSKKELAEHNTIVDLIRNDLSRVANQVNVSRFCYIDKIHSNMTDLLQMSSEITGLLAENSRDQLGDLFGHLLPAGSVSGAPKKKTIEIIRKAEQYERGFYTGIFGVFDGTRVDSCVLIRFLEKEGDQLIFKSGGGITHLSQCEDEYLELIKKIYVPIA